MYGILHKEKQSQSVNPDGAELMVSPFRRVKPELANAPAISKASEGPTLIREDNPELSRT